jgi:DAK2 domain fusion protein YloV
MEALAALRASDVADAVRVFGDALRRHRPAIDALNVYPVPDGDTGTNMALTIESVVAELDALQGATRSEGSLAMRDVCRALAHGSLMGARGNSGVILSQLLRGLAGVLSAAGPDGAADDDEVAGPARVAAALRAASTSADQAVLRPVEGTILSVARAAADAVAPCVAPTADDGHDGGPGGGCGDLVSVLTTARQAAADALARTPEQLPVLARAGVVDAGGAGFVLLLDALLHVVDGRPVPPPPEPAGGVDRRMAADSGASASTTGDEAPWEPPGEAGERSTDLRYEVMYLLEAPDDTIPAFKEVWAGLGDSIVVVGGDGLWNCHIHTDEVGPAIEAALDAGRPRDIRVTDLRDQVEELRWVREGSATADDEPAGPPPRTAVVAVASGDGIRRILRSLGVHHFVTGGQSMNPSTAEILDVVASVRSPEVVLLPNNANIHPVANQVCALAAVPVRVVPTTSIVEGFAALLEYDPEASADDNAIGMGQSARRVVAAEVVRAVRDADGPDGPIRAGDWLGTTRQGIEVVGDGLVEVATALIGKLLLDHHELVTLIEGDGATPAVTRQITEWLAEHRPRVAVEVHHGGQPLYPYLISIE